jgi:hypothetical protein
MRTEMVGRVILCVLLGFSLGSSRAETPVQLRLKKIRTVNSAQPFAGELRVGASGRLEPAAKLVVPQRGHVFWLFEVEFANPGRTRITIAGSKMSAKTAQGEAVRFWLFLGTAFIPYGATSWTLEANKKKTEKFLALVAEDVQDIEFTYEGASPPAISIRRNPAP